MVERRVLVAAAAFAFFSLMSVLTQTADARSCFIRIGDHRIRVEVADTPEKKISGLSHHRSLREDEGMLFIYGDKGIRTFWMKDMLFDLDIIWIAGDRIVGIARNARAEGGEPLRSYDSEVPVNLVLEINAGLCDRWGVREGQRIFISEQCLPGGPDSHRPRRAVLAP